MTFDFLSQHAISPRSHPYEHSLASSASSSSSSVFSNDAASQTSSTSSSSSTAAAWEADEGVWRGQACPESFRANGDAPATVKRVLPPLPSIETSLPARQRHHHPRRCSVSRPPPTLVRQSERKEQFVDGLVGEFKFFSGPPLALAYSVCFETPQP